MTAVVIPLPSEVRRRDVVHNTTHVAHRPVGAITHIANARPAVAHDGWPDASPDWEDLTLGEQEDHRQTCHNLCRFCEDHRAFGECTGCGGDTEAIGVDELSRCCVRPVILGPEDDNPRAA